MAVYQRWMILDCELRNSFEVPGDVEKTRSFKYSQRKKSGRVRSGDRGGQSGREISRSSKNSL